MWRKRPSRNDYSFDGANTFRRLTCKTLSVWAYAGPRDLQAVFFFCITSVTPRARYFSFIPWSDVSSSRPRRFAAEFSGLARSTRRDERICRELPP